MELTFPFASGDRAEAAVTTGAPRMRLTSATLVMVAGETCPDPQLVERFVDRLPQPIRRFHSIDGEHEPQAARSSESASATPRHPAGW